MKKIIFILICLGLLSACAGQPIKEPVPPENSPSTSNPSSNENGSTSNVPSPDNQTSTAENANKPGGYYLDDGPEANPPPNIDQIPDAVPKEEPLNPTASKPYKALGETYVPMTTYKPFTQSGIASWYGKRFHGRKTANGEVYDMYAMTAAHPRLPLPSYVKVTNPSNNRSVVVRVNDRGPFKHSRIIDLSYAAAYKLRIVDRGSAPVEIEAVDVKTFLAHNKNASPVPKQIESTVVSSNTVNAQSNIKTAIQQFFVQVGAFKLEANANQLKQKIQNLGIANQDNINHVYNNQLYRLKLGPYANKSKASEIASIIKKQLNISSIINTQ